MLVWGGGGGGGGGGGTGSVGDLMNNWDEVICQ